MVIIEKKYIYNGKFVNFISKKYEDNLGNIKNYEYSERNNTQKAVVIIPFIQEENAFVLIKQFRIPFEDYIIEFPAGLIDENESEKSTVIRELKEETGYEGEIVKISKETPSTPGLTTEEVYFAFVKVTKKGEQQLEPSEIITVEKVDKYRWEELKNEDIKIQSWVYLFLEIYFNKDKIFL